MQKIRYKGKEYSQAALAELLQLSRPTIRKYAEEARFKGEDLERIIERNVKTYQYNGMPYKSLSELSNATGINRKTLTNLINTYPDKTIDEIVLEYKDTQKEYTYGDKTYRTIEEAAKGLGLAKSTVSKYLKLANGNFEKAIQLYKKENSYAVVDGIRYETQEQLAQTFQVSVTTLSKYIEEEGNIQLAIDRIRSKETYTWRGNTYKSLESLSRAMGIPRPTIVRILENEANGDLEEAYNIYQRRNRRKYKGYTFNGKEYSSIIKALEDLGISYKIYNNRCKGNDKSFEEIVSEILKEKAEREEKKKEDDEIKRQKELEKQRSYTYRGKEIHTIKEISEETGIPYTTLWKILQGHKEGRIDDIIQNHLTNTLVYTYGGKSFESIKSLAEHTGLNELRLGRYIRKYNRDAEKAIFMIKLMDSKRERAQSLSENSETNSTDKNTATRRERIMYDATRSLHQYCIENKINYSCIYYAVKYLGRTMNEALENYNTNGQKIPTSWIYEKHNILLKHLLLNEGINSGEIISEMREKMISLDEALKNYIIKDEAKKSNSDPEWQMEMYPILTSDYISAEEKEEFRKEFFVTDNEMESLNKAKDRVNKMKRKILLYEIAECFRNGVYPENEMVEILKEYEITEQEVDTIFLDLYSRFNEGVRLAEGEELLRQRRELNDCIRNYDNMTDEERKCLEKTRPQDIGYIRKVSAQIAFYKNSVRLKTLTGQDIGKIGYTASVKECDNGDRILKSIIEGRSMEGEDIDDNK